jgi:protein-S-isoprenylcysteine O-methyltransferase Ste14
MYAALTAFFLSSTLVSGNGLLIALGLALSGLLRLRTGLEERMLADHFGDAYRRYQARTGRYLPPLTPRKRTR